MKIYTNPGNPFGFQLQLMAKFAKKQVNLEKVNLSGMLIKLLT